MGTRPAHSVGEHAGGADHTLNRRKFQGVEEIVAYNRGFYLSTSAALIGVLIASKWAPPLLRLIAVVVAAGAALWMIVSLAVSHYVYDRSSLYSLDWLTVRPKTWLNLHAGLDQMTSLLREKLTASNSYEFDIFDPAQMTELSIERARQLNGSHLRAVSWQDLPVASHVFDAVFLIFVAHEFRKTRARHMFFREARRVLKPGGSIILVEHLRDLPNFLAYGPGCFHFQSRRTWTEAFYAAGLKIRDEQTITPFVHVFELTHE